MSEVSYTNCYIAFLDVLGFKNMVKHRNCDDIYKIYSKKMVKPLCGLSLGTKPIIDMRDIKMKVMSDSICFYIDAKKQNALVGLIATCQSFQYELLRLEKPVLIRGSILCGDLYADGDITFGPGFVDAYLMEEHNAKYPRIILTKDTVELGCVNTEEEMKPFLYSMLFEDEDAFLMIDYWELFEGTDINNKECSRMAAYIDHILATDIDNSIREKFLYMKKSLSRYWKFTNMNDHRREIVVKDWTKAEANQTEN